MEELTEKIKHYENNIKDMSQINEKEKLNLEIK